MSLRDRRGPRRKNSVGAWGLKIADHGIGKRKRRPRPSGSSRRRPKAEPEAEVTKTTFLDDAQLAGAYWGESGIPQEWRDGLARPEMIEKALPGIVGEQADEQVHAGVRLRRSPRRPLRLPAGPATRGERTLRSYSRPVNLARLDGQHWMTDEEDVWCVPELLIAARHYALFPDKVARALPRLDRRSFEAGMHGRVKH